jgi:dinuclear metal center YbgI/SA1388 family protein
MATTGTALRDTVGVWMDLVHELYPPSDALAWDHPGLQVGDPAWPVERVLVSLDVTRGVLEEAATVPGTLLLAHHPLLLDPLRAVTPATVAGALALFAARSGVAVAAAHTNLDAADDGAGTSDPVVVLLDLVDVRSLCPPATTGARAMGRVGDLRGPLTLRALAEHIAVGLPSGATRIVGAPDRVIRRVAVLGGSGSSAVPDALAAGADVLVTGDVRHHVALDALELGLAMIDAGHHATEVAAMPHFAERVRRAAAARGLGADVVLSTTDTTPWEHV